MYESGVKVRELGCIEILCCLQPEAAIAARISHSHHARLMRPP